MAVAGVSLTLSLAVGWLVLSMLGRDLRDLFETPPKTTRPAHIWRDDPVLGYAHIPGAVGRHEAMSSDGEVIFSVEYHIGADGCRVGAEGRGQRPSLLFLGGSFTFGHGVGDDEAFPAVLQREYWPGYAVRNCGVMGWGTSNAYLWLRAELERETPTAVFYGFTPSHLDRNYISREWLQVVHPRRVPHFELLDGRLELGATVGLEDAVPSSRAVRAVQRKLTRRLIGEMKALCDAAGIPFRVLILPTRKNSPRSDRMLRYLAKMGVRDLDLRGRAEGYFPGDRHPTPAWHRALATALAEAVPLDTLARRTKADGPDPLPDGSRAALRQAPGRVD